jgi:squalene-hopene/tetraprenyl-beta-curcumene cyclase
MAFWHWERLPMNNTGYYNTYLSLRQKLTDERNNHGFWTGELAISALSTAVSIVALKVAGYSQDRDKIADGYKWLCNHINKDGGYGDTPESISNVSTTLLCYAAIHFCRPSDASVNSLLAMENWLDCQGIVMQDSSVTKSVLDFYGKDYTFSIPILSMLVICKVLPEKALNKIPGLPFEFSLFPASWYRFLNLHVVSYALPALIAVGIYHYTNRKRKLSGSGMRKMLIKPSLKKLNSLIPESGGFLEATPLTAFVSMCLICSGNSESEIVKTGLLFIRKQQRESGGWPIDTDLSTWVTTLSVKALGQHVNQVLNESERTQLKEHILSLQYKTIHPFNGAKPGGWGWTSFSGSVPDADDTPGAILALLELYSGESREISAIESGCKWLVEIQNTDGGFPTFCRGWGKLPFDKSCADLTGHAICALIKTVSLLRSKISPGLLSRIDKCIHMAMGYLNGVQSSNGSWLPLWFGNQLTPGKTNPVYGTAKVCIYLKDCLESEFNDRELLQHLGTMVAKAMNYLLSQQNDDGSWGGGKGIPGTIEETALAVSALSGDHEEVCKRGMKFLGTREISASPIGLYFAMLWYDEKLYPLIYYVEALRRYLGKM